MPKKFIAYRTLCFVNLILLTILLLLLLYTLFFEMLYFEVLPFVIVLAGIAVYYINAFWGINLVQRYKSSSGISKNKISIIITWFLFQVVLQFITFVNIVNDLSNLSYYTRRAFQLGDMSLLLMSFLPYLIFLATLYCQVLTFPLIKAVKLRSEDLIKSIGEGGNPE